MCRSIVCIVEFPPNCVQGLCKYLYMVVIMPLSRPHFVNIVKPATGTAWVWTGCIAYNYCLASLSALAPARVGRIKRVCVWLRKYLAERAIRIHIIK